MEVTDVNSRPGVIARRPLVTTGTLAALVAAVLALLTSFGVPLTDAQQAAVSGLAAVLAPLVVALVGHRLVTPVSNPRDNSGRQLVPAEPGPAPGDEPGRESGDEPPTGPAAPDAAPPSVPAPRWPSE